MARPPKPQGLPATVDAKAPEKPNDLSPVASVEWDQIIAELTTLGTLSTADRAAVHMASLYCGYFVEAAEDVRANGLTLAMKLGRKANPSIRARDDGARIRKTYLEALGLTPASRSRVSVVSPDGDGPSLEDILDGTGKD